MAYLGTKTLMNMPASHCSMLTSIPVHPSKEESYS